MAAPSPQQPPTPARLTLPQRGAVVFLGDSITWQNYYTALVETAVARRLPERHLRWVNLGVRGDAAVDVRRRLQRDLVPHNPVLIFVMLGINDGGMGPPSGRLLDDFDKSMRRLLDAIAELSKAPVVLLTPTCVAPSDTRMATYNQTLAAMSARLLQLGTSRAVPTIDVHTSFCAAQKRARTSTPPIELMLNDGLHPNAAGHLVIAHAILNALELPPRNATRIPVPGSICDGKPVTVSLRHDHQNVWLPLEARSALALVPWNELFVGPRLSGGGGCPIQVSVDDNVVFNRRTRSDADDIHLDAMDDAPWQREALDVWTLTQTRWRWFYARWDPRGLGPAALRDVGGPRMSAADIAARAGWEIDRAHTALQSNRRQAPRTYQLRVGRAGR